MKELQHKDIGNYLLYDNQMARKWIQQLRDVSTAKSPCILELSAL